MGLLPPFKRNQPAPAAPPATPDAAAQARTQARRRLIGAAVLLAIGVIGFPLLFETQPRPVRMDIPIEMPRKDNAPPLVMPPAPASAAAQAAPAGPGPAPVPSPPPIAAAASAAPALVTERAGEQGREVPPPVKPEPSVRAVQSAPERVAAPASTPRAVAAVPSHPAAPVDDGARAQAILNGLPVPPAASGATVRIVVQVGAYTDDAKLHEVRARIERLGLKTYTQVVDADGAKRTRVRVGPFGTRAEADRAAAKIKSAGLPVAMLTL